MSQWRSVFSLTAGIYILGAVAFLLFGSTKVQKWNDPSESARKDSRIYGIPEAPSCIELAEKLEKEKATQREGIRWCLIINLFKIILGIYIKIIVTRDLNFCFIFLVRWQNDDVCFFNNHKKFRNFVSLHYYQLCFFFIVCKIKNFTFDFLLNQKIHFWFSVKSKISLLIVTIWRKFFQIRK